MVILNALLYEGEKRPMWNWKKKIIYIMYLIFAKWLPESRHLNTAKKIRAFFAKGILQKMGKNVNIEKGALFSPGIQIGNDSGIGLRSEIYGSVIIGDSVMMGPEVIIYTRNHKHIKDKPFYQQGYEEEAPVSIGDNVWIGRRVMFMPGSSVGANVVVGAGAVVTKKFGDNVIIGGVPARIIGKV